jgi:protein ImuB
MEILLRFIDHHSFHIRNKSKRDDMAKRFVSIWFRHLTTDWFTVRKQELKDIPFVLRAPSRGRMLIVASNAHAERKGVRVGMALADARAVLPELQALDNKPQLADELLKRIAEWCIRFTPIVAVDPPNGVLLDATGCSHLWGGDEHYLADIISKFHSQGYDVSAAIADTIGVAWAVARFGASTGSAPFRVVQPGRHIEALLPLPPGSLRIELPVVERLHKLGLRHVKAVY